MSDIKEFKKTLFETIHEYDEHGPMESGITIEETTKRVTMFTVIFQVIIQSLVRNVFFFLG